MVGKLRRILWDWHLKTDHFVGLALRGSEDHLIIAMIITQLAFTSSKLTIETLEQGVIDV